MGKLIVEEDAGIARGWWTLRDADGNEVYVYGPDMESNARLVAVAEKAVEAIKLEKAGCQAEHGEDSWCNEQVTPPERLAVERAMQSVLDALEPPKAEPDTRIADIAAEFAERMEAIRNEVARADAAFAVKLAAIAKEVK